MTGFPTAYAPAVLAGACALLGVVFYLMARHRAITMAHSLDRARTDSEFVQWARWTFVSVTDHEGAPFYCSLYDLQDQPPDLIWGFPRSVIIFNASPDDPDPYRPTQERDHG